ncbi:HNH endonuclease [Pseudomonas lurida]|uniref:HNH endonuclease n=1 Tax=Pseudomonas lurida TaxID=244566 RepID=UPI001B802D47|nr:HNH endonuclease [Pseudomonas lurida]
MAKASVAPSPTASAGGEQGGKKDLDAPAKVDYSSIENPPNVGPGKEFTLRQKQEALELNKAANDGVVKSDLSGTVLVQPQKSQRGVTPDPNEWQFDHVKSKNCGGTNCSSNIQILSRQENRIKSDK